MNDDLAMHGFMVRRLVADEKSASGMRLEFVPLKDILKDEPKDDVIRQLVETIRQLESERSAWLREGHRQAAEWHRNEIADFDRQVINANPDGKKLWKIERRFHQQSADSINQLPTDPSGYVVLPEKPLRHVINTLLQGIDPVPSNEFAEIRAALLNSRTGEG